LNVVSDANGMPIEDPSNPNAYLTKEIESTNGTLLPSVGIFWMF